MVAPILLQPVSICHFRARVWRARGIPNSRQANGPGFFARQPRARMTSKESCMTRIVTGLSRTAPVFTLALPCERSNNGLSEKSSMLLKWHRLPACVSWSVNAEMVEPLPRSARRWTMESQRAPSMPETREIVRSTRAADRIAAARAWLAAAPAAAEVLVVAPTREAADDLVRE